MPDTAPEEAEKHPAGTSPPPSIWKESFDVRSYEVDRAGQANLLTLCNYLQEGAGNHAAALGVSVEHLQEKHMTWVLSRMHIQVTQYPTWKERVMLQTWPSGHNGLLASREFVLQNAHGDPLAIASTAWLLVDTRRLRPLRIPPFIDAIRTPHEAETPILNPFPRLPLPDAPSHETRYAVRHHDIDMNQHANNVAFVAWGLETLPQEHHDAFVPVQCEIQYKAEAGIKDVVISEAHLSTSPDGADGVHGLFVDRENRKEIARMRTRWSRR